MGNTIDPNMSFGEALKTQFDLILKGMELISERVDHLERRIEKIEKGEQNASL